jgi:hypothetical protein
MHQTSTLAGSMDGLAKGSAWKAVTGYFYRERVAARRFLKQRSDYYETIADRMTDAKGKTLRDFFEDDANRYATDESGRTKYHPRAVLSAIWAERYSQHAGDLGLVFEGTLPDEDVALIRIGQESGSDALAETFRDLARISGIIQKAKENFLTTIFVGLIGVALVVLDLIALPTYIAPTILSFVSNLPKDMYPPVAKSFFGFSDFLEANLILILLAIASGIWAVNWSLPNYVGPWRATLDRFLVWRLYRDFQGALFVAVLATIIKFRGGSSVSLDGALEQLKLTASPYLRQHINRMMDNRTHMSQGGMSDGEAVTRTLDTGLIDRETMWYLLDVQEGAGIAAGLQRTGAKIEGPIMKRIVARALVVRWALLLFGLLVSLGVAVWSRQVVSAMIQALKNFYAS